MGRYPSGTPSLPDVIRERTYNRIMTATDGLDGTGIAIWDERHTEHLALRAAEIGDADTEALCDEVMAGLADPAILVDVICFDAGYQEWMVRGRNLGWSTRSV